MPLDKAYLQAKTLWKDGADIIDVGGESTRPGAQQVSAAQEIDRVLPLIEKLSKNNVVISIDTTKQKVAAAAYKAGATIVNDISGGLFDPTMVDWVKDKPVVYVCGHVRGKTIADVHSIESEKLSTELGWEQVAKDLSYRIEGFPSGLRNRTWVDPCLGFGKGPEVNRSIVRHCGLLEKIIGRPVALGPSRKRFVSYWIQKLEVDREVPREAASPDDNTSGKILTPSSRLDFASAGICAAARAQGIRIFRMHEIRHTRAILDAFDAYYKEGGRITADSRANNNVDNSNLDLMEIV